MSRGTLHLMSLATLSSVAHGRSGRTYYTDARVAAARANVAELDWAKREQHRIVEHGDQIQFCQFWGQHT